MTPEEEDSASMAELRDALPPELANIPELQPRMRGENRELPDAIRFIQDTKSGRRKKAEDGDLDITGREIKQDQFLTLLLQGTMWKDAANICAIDHATAKRWLYSKKLRQRFEQCRDAIIDAQLTRVCSSVGKAVHTLERALDEADEWRDRIMAAKELINGLGKFHQMAGIDSRLRDLEHKLGEVVQVHNLPVTAPVEDVTAPPAKRIMALAKDIDLTLPDDEDGV